MCSAPHTPLSVSASLDFPSINPVSTRPLGLSSEQTSLLQYTGDNHAGNSRTDSKLQHRHSRSDSELRHRYSRSDPKLRHGYPYPGDARHATRFCRHRGSCLESAWHGFVKSAAVGLSMKCGVTILYGLFFGKIFRDPRAVILELMSLDTARFGVFTALYLGGFRGCQCLLRRIRRRDDQWNAFVAGWLAGLSILCDVRNRRKTISIFITMRSIAFGSQLLVSKGLLPTIPHTVPLLFCLGSMETMYAYGMHPRSLPKSF
eukprot:264638_1